MKAFGLATIVTRLEAELRSDSYPSADACAELIHLLTGLDYSLAYVVIADTPVGSMIRHRLLVSLLTNHVHE